MTDEPPANPPRKFEKPPGPGWEIKYRWPEDEEEPDVQTMTVFGVATDAGALREVHDVLSRSGEVYEILTVRRILEDDPEVEAFFARNVRPGGPPPPRKP